MFDWSIVFCRVPANQKSDRNPCSIRLAACFVGFNQYQNKGENRAFERKSSVDEYLIAGPREPRRFSPTIPKGQAIARRINHRNYAALRLKALSGYIKPTDRVQPVGIIRFAPYKLMAPIWIITADLCPEKRKPSDVTSVLGPDR